jgi:hypothetical protein
MSRFLSICATFILATSAFADEKPKPNTLTPKEIAEGWILLFDGETSYGWTFAVNRENAKPEVTAKDGSLVIANKASVGANSQSKSAVTCTTSFECFEMKGEYRTTTEDSHLVVVNHNRGSKPEDIAGTITTSYRLSRSKGDEWRTFLVRLSPQKGVKERIIGLSDGNEPGTEYVLHDVILAEIGFGLPEKKEGRIELRNLKLRPLETKPLFNGKDLDGWSINKADPKRMASKWEVTKESELSLKNGPGDLVSEKEFDNFVLQLECKTLGDALNSGVFFRNMPGQYQNGYEAQIQNSYKVGDRTKPIDFGTGAIYRRIPARKVVSNDNEWFTMTVVAEGKHIATWVNGYQTVDWIDDRPADENPRKGYRAAKGPLSLQGHDKGTDLLFRNIRIAELPVEKMTAEKK